MHGRPRRKGDFGKRLDGDGRISHALPGRRVSMGKEKQVQRP